jgi:outer membrane protein assembly factor BamB
MRMRQVVAVVLVLVVLSPAFGGEQATGWRSDGTGRFPSAEPPLAWERAKGVVWSAEVGKCNSSPVVVGGKVFVTSEPDLLVCVDLATGKVLWRKSNSLADLPAELRGEPQHKITAEWGGAIPTPASDGSRVYVSFVTGIVAAYDLEGNRAWVRLFDLPRENQYGRSASPILAGGRLIVGIHHLIALDPKSGATLWEAPDAKLAYGTPAAARVAGVDVICTPRGDVLRAADGKLIAGGLGTFWYTSPVVDGGVAYFVDQRAVAVRLPEAAGDTPHVTRLWQQELDGQFFASPVVHDGLVYAVNNSGMLYVLDAKTGDTVLEKELDIPSAAGKPDMPPANIYPSPALAGKHLFIWNDAGQTLILEPGRNYKEVGRGRLPDGSGSTPAFAGNRILVRGGKNLYCISRKP